MGRGEARGELLLGRNSRSEILAPKRGAIPLVRSATLSPQQSITILTVTGEYTASTRNKALKRLDEKVMDAYEIAPRQTWESIDQAVSRKSQWELDLTPGEWDTILWLLERADSDPDIVFEAEAEDFANVYRSISREKIGKRQKWGVCWRCEDVVLRGELTSSKSGDGFSMLCSECREIPVLER